MGGLCYYVQNGGEMIWKLEDLINGDVPQVCINGKWVTARPINYRYKSVWQRIKEAWAVYTGNAEAFIWPEGQ
jgi:hypothetical protein